MFAFSNLFSWLETLFTVCTSVEAILVKELPEGTTRDDLVLAQSIIDKANAVTAAVQEAIDAHPESPKVSI